MKVWPFAEPSYNQVFLYKIIRKKLQESDKRFCLVAERRPNLHVEMIRGQIEPNNTKKNYNKINEDSCNESNDS